MTAFQAILQNRTHHLLGAMMACGLTLPLATAQISQKEVDRQLEEETQINYSAAKMVPKDTIGTSKAKQGGWPGPGMQMPKMRFIRLQHDGRGWDDGMDKSGADTNFLKELAEQTGFKTSEKGESHPIAHLKKYPKDAFPPFVFLTGNGPIGRISVQEISILRSYCLNGGMLIADAGSADFHKSFTHLMRKVFPDKPLLDVGDDDMIFQLPHNFHKGAPAFWSHGGRRAMGIKHEGRWVCFYHPGDFNDAWKSKGYTDVTPEMRQDAMNLGVNLVFYAFNQWEAAIAAQRKQKN